MIFVMAKYFTLEDVYYIDSGSASLGNDELRYLLAKILTRVPKEIVDAVYEDCLFLLINASTKGSFFPNRLIERKHIIIFPEDLLDWAFEEQVDKVLDAVAHYILNHKSVLEFDNDEWEKQEQEAEDLRNRWLLVWSEMNKKAQSHRKLRLIMEYLDKDLTDRIS